MAGVRRRRTALSGPYRRLRRRVLHVGFAVRRPGRVGMPNGRTLYLDRSDARSFALWQASGNVDRRSMALRRALLLPKGDAARCGIGQRAAALTASLCPA